MNCASGEQCIYAHGQDELVAAAIIAYGDCFREKKCRKLYKDKTCFGGSNCLFKHEYMTMSKLLRHIYTPRVFKLELLFGKTMDQTKNLDALNPDNRVLSVF